MTGLVMLTRAGSCGGGGGGNGEGDKGANKSSEEEQNQVSMVALLLVAVRKSMVACHVERGEEFISAIYNMDIGWPTNVQHLTHVTFIDSMGFWAFRWSSRLRFQAEFPVPGILFFKASKGSNVRLYWELDVPIECKCVWRLSGVNAAVFRFKRE